MLQRIMTIFVVVAVSSSVWAGDAEMMALSDELLAEAQNLWRRTHAQVYSGQRNAAELRANLAALRSLVGAYEKQVGIGSVPVPPPVEQPVLPQPPVIDRRYLGMSSPAKDGEAVLYTDARTRGIRYRKINIEHAAGSAHVRIHRITVVTAAGKQLVFEAGGGKYFLGDRYEVELPRPAFISEIRVHVQHQTGGLRITGEPAPEPVALPTVITLGTTNGVKDGYAVLNTTRPHRKVAFRKLRIKNIGGDKYVRLGSVEVHTVGDKTIMVPVNGGKFRPGDVMEIELPRAVRIKSLQAYVQHRVSGLEVEGVR